MEYVFHIIIMVCIYIILVLSANLTIGACVKLHSMALALISEHYS